MSERGSSEREASERAFPIVLAATSGTGKTTLARRLVADSDRYVFSVSATTRPPRRGEQDGVDYHFLSRREFRKRIEGGDFVEWAEVHGRLYGTPRTEIEAAARRGEHVVLDIDVQGARQIRDTVPDAKLIFVLPPSVDIMMARLQRRGSEDPANVARRLHSALSELQAVPEFDYVVVNDDLDECLHEIQQIVEGAAEQEGGLEETAERIREGIAELIESRYSTYLKETQ